MKERVKEPKRKIERESERVKGVGMAIKKIKFKIKNSHVIQRE